MIGAVVISAVVLGAATAALAAAPGDPFRLGKRNVINKVTKLVGKANSPRLVIDNNGSGVALSLQVQDGQAPLKVNSSGKVENLNADKLDGKNSNDFLSASTYTRSGAATGSGGANETSHTTVSCDAGDVLLSGGYRGVDPGTHVKDNQRFDGRTWMVVWVNDATVDFVGISITCADTTP